MCKLVLIFLSVYKLVLSFLFYVQICPLLPVLCINLSLLSCLSAYWPLLSCLQILPYFLVFEQSFFLALLCLNKLIHTRVCIHICSDICTCFFTFLCKLFKLDILQLLIGYTRASYILEPVCWLHHPGIWLHLQPELNPENQQHFN